MSSPRPLGVKMTAAYTAAIRLLARMEELMNLSILNRAEALPTEATNIAHIPLTGGVIQHFLLYCTTRRKFSTVWKVHSLYGDGVILE